MVLIVSIVKKNKILYKIGYYLYSIYASIYMILLFILFIFLNQLSKYIPLIPDSYKLYILIGLFVQVIVQLCFLVYLKAKIKIFEAYELYARTKENRLIQQPNIV